MVRFIMLCMAVVVLSFAFAPVFSGISKEHQNLMAAAEAPQQQPQGDISFEEIYRLAENAIESNPALLNNIMPAAGEAHNDQFSMGFSNREDSALENTQSIVENTEETL